MKKFSMILSGSLLLLFICGIFWAVSVSNAEKRLVNRMDAQKEVISLFYDKMWKILKQKAGVAEQAKEAYKEIFVPLIEGRYSKNDGSLMKWITEHNPSFDVSLYKDVQNSIEAERNGFFIEQKKMTDMNRQHEDMRELFPKSLICGNRLSYEYLLITSDVTENVINTGKDNDISLFN